MQNSFRLYTNKILFLLKANFILSYLSFTTFTRNMEVCQERYSQKQQSKPNYTAYIILQVYSKNAVREELIPFYFNLNAVRSSNQSVCCFSTACARSCLANE